LSRICNIVRGDLVCLMRPGTDYGEPSDEELCRKIASAMRCIRAHGGPHQGRAYRLASSILGNEADARDVSQDAFIRLYESAGRFDGRSRFSTWFYGYWLIVHRHQRKNRWWEAAGAAGESGDDPTTRFRPPSSEAGPEDEAMLKHR